MTTCITCKVELKPCIVSYRGEQLEAMHCPKCKEKIFTEELTMKAIQKLEARRLQTEYVKKPLRIGKSIGMTFPKEVSRTFNLDAKNAKIHIFPKLADGRIIIEVED